MTHRLVARAAHALPSLTACLALALGALPAFAQPLVKAAIQVDPGNTKQDRADLRLSADLQLLLHLRPLPRRTGRRPAAGRGQFVSTVPASPTGDVAAINVTPNFAAADARACSS